MRRYIAPLFVIATLTLSASITAAQEPDSASAEEPDPVIFEGPVPMPVGEPGWTGPVIARGPLREEIEATPIPYRPYRPFHFYGNTIRRMHYRGTIVPNPSDVLQGGSALLRPARPRLRIGG